ncbi:MAG: phenylacetate--CoA ligase family protein [Bacteroidetes bacterium]|nr:phenylacetate--CoA ligase family protein [Bacteroidota bacterium]
MNLKEKIYSVAPVALQNAMVSAYGFSWRKRRMGGIFHQEYYEAKNREDFTSEQWNEYQVKQLQKLLLHAMQTVPYYQQRFAQFGLHEKSIHHVSLDTLNQFPVLSKYDLQNNGTTSLLSHSREKRGAFFPSSGSTGTPVNILFSHKMHQRWYALFESRVRNWAGVSSMVPRGMIGGRRVLPKASGGPPFFRYNAAEKQVYFSAYHINKKNALNYLEGMKKYQVQYMTGYAMSNYFLAQLLRENQVDPFPLKCVITSSEKLTDEMRQLFASVYHCKTYDSWSGVEACGLISECEAGGLHISPDAGLIEVLDEDLKPVEPGVVGKVYCTGFINFDQPLIRYAIGDEIMLSDKACTCGRNMPLVQEICGRQEDVIIGKDGRQMVRFHRVFYHLKSVKRAQVIQHSLDEITIRVETELGLSKEDEEQIRKRISSQLENLKVHIETCREIPLSRNGKFQAVISEIKHPH